MGYNRELRRRLGFALRGAGYADDLLASILGTTGNLIFVDSATGRSTWDGQSADRACATIDQAVNQATASKGDIIVVMPGHAETLSAAAAIAIDKAGLTIIGLGRGTDRPQITFDNTAATITISAANTVIRNIHFINDVDSLVVGLVVTAAHCLLDGCLFDDATAAKQTLDWITLSADADYFECVDCEHHGSDTAGAQSVISGAAADHVKIRRLVSHGDLAAANIEMTAAWTDCLIEDCSLENANAVDVCIEGFAAATGWVRFNTLTVATDGQVTGINTPGALSLFENYQVNDDGEAGILVGTPSV